MPHPNRDGHKSTTNMKKHLKMCSKYKAVQRTNGSDNRVDLLGELFLDIPRRRPVMTSELLREKALRIVIAGNQSFSQVENPEFVDLLKDAYPDCTPPSRRAVTDLLHSSAQQARNEIAQRLSELDSKVSLALDLWSTRHNLAFLGMSSW